MDHQDLPTIEKKIGAQVREIRIKRQISQTKIADILGVSFQQFQKYERGTNRISPGKLILLAGHLNIDINDFFAGVYEQSEDKHQLSEEEQILEIFRSIEDTDVKRKVIDLCSAISQKK